MTLATIRTAVVLLVTVALLVQPGIGWSGGGMDTMKGRATAKSKYPFNETVSRIKQAIEAQEMMVIQTVDMQAMLQMVGVQAKGMQQVLFFHPRYGKAIYESDRMAGIEAPLKLVVMEGDMGTVISYYKPSHVFATYPKLKALGDELDGVLGRIAEAATK